MILYKLCQLKLLYSNVQLYILQTTVQKFGVSKIFLFEDINTFILQGLIQWIKNDNDFYIVAKKMHFKWMLFFWTFYSSKYPGEKCIMISTKILSSNIEM